MTFYKRIMYYLRFRAKGKKQIFKILDREANLYYDRCDYLQSNREATFFSLMVANISCEIYEQMIYGLRHKFKDELFDLDAIKAMYRINIMYFYIKLAYDYPHEWEVIKDYDFKGIARLSPKERRLLSNHLIMTQLNPDTFELEFLKFYSKAVFKQKILSPYTVALAGNILYNSYEGFVEDFSMHMMRFKIA